VSGAQVAQHNLSACDHAAKRNFCKLLKPMIYRRLNQRAAAKITRLAGKDLHACSACGANGEVREHPKHGVISSLKECIQALRTTLGARRLTIGTLSLSIRS
jgi:hypothetical protein